jgi:DNA end-binding protein Ku
MSSRPIASLTISFGLVSIPVQAFSATESAGRISFNLLHRKCGSRLRQQYLCIKEGTVVERSEMIKGYEFAKDQYVEFTPEEIKALEAVGSDAVDIVEFVPLAAIDPVYFDKTYYLGPDRGGSKPYALLVDALHESKRCAIGNWAARGKQYIVALRAVEGIIVMQQLHYASEVRPATEISVPEVSLKDAERKLAMQLIEQQTSKAFDPGAYTDEVKARVDAAIQEKIEGKEITTATLPKRPATQNVIDLMEVLRKSLQDAEGSRGKTARLAARKPAQRITKPAARREKAKQR